MWASLEPLEPELFWILCVGFVIAFLLAFSVGANDVSNSFGTSVGSRTLTFTQACILATFFEVTGATLLGYAVCDTFRRNVYDVSQYDNAQKELMLGALSCLIGSAAWNMIATALKMPISGTHSIVGATIGFSVVLRGWGSIKWMMILRIVASWFASPLLSGLISSLIYLFISKTIIRKADALKNGLKALPLFYGITIFINVASIVINGPNVFGLDKLSWYAGLFISLLITGITICLVALLMVPRLRRKILDDVVVLPLPAGKASKELDTSLSRLPAIDGEKKGVDNEAFKPDVEPNNKNQNLTELALDVSKLEQEAKKERPTIAPKPSHLLPVQRQSPATQLEEIDLTPTKLAASVTQTRSIKIKTPSPSVDFEKAESGQNSTGAFGMIRGERVVVAKLFSSLQILTACFASFAHGTNDVSNAVAPLIPIWNIYSQGFEDIHRQSQIWILAFGGIGICTGLWAWGRAVMSTVGDGLTQLTPSKGFAIELGAAISVLCATKLGLPISTTHCKVGSVVIVGLVSAKFCSQDNLLEMSKEEQEKEGSKSAVDWKLFGNIAITWLVTVPLAASASALVMLLLKWLVL